MDSYIPYIHSFPRSGTHLLAATIKRNFYSGVDIGTQQSRTGHWKARKPWGAMSYGQLFRPSGAHGLSGNLDENRTHIYIYRDGRDVAVSLWNAKIMLNPEWRQWPFSKFLRAKLDWLWSPGGHIDHPRWTVADQWKRHLEHWYGKDVFLVQYELLVKAPIATIIEIADDIGGDWEGVQFIPVRDKVGVSPGVGKVGTWRSVFSGEDLDYFHSIVPWDHWGLWRENDIHCR